MYLLSVVGQAEPRRRLSVGELLDPLEEVVAPVAVRHRDVALVAGRLVDCRGISQRYNNNNTF